MERTNSSQSTGYGTYQQQPEYRLRNVQTAASVEAMERTNSNQSKGYGTYQQQPE
jgi:hypothetical protein